MSTRRYARSPIVKSGSTIGTGRAAIAIYTAVKNGSIGVTKRQLKAGERLDTVAGANYGDAGLWWVIAAASGIGWGLSSPTRGCYCYSH